MGVRKALEDIAREEMMHVGGFLAVLLKLDKELRKGFEGVKELVGFDAWERLRE